MSGRNPGAEHNPEHYESTGMPKMWQGAPNSGRLDRRYGLFFMTPGPRWTQSRLCWPTIHEAIACADRLPQSWRVDHVYDFVSQKVVHVFSRMAVQ